MEDFSTLFPIEGRLFWPGSDSWRAHVDQFPIIDNTTDRVCFGLRFVSQDGRERSLQLWASRAGLHTEPLYREKLLRTLDQWLSIDSEQAELFAFN